MPNWVVNKITVDGKDAAKIVKSHLMKDGNGDCQFDLNTIERMPDELQIEKSSRSADGFKLYLAKIHPLIPNLGGYDDKVRPFGDYVKEMETLFDSKDYERIGQFILKPKEIDELKEKYGEKFDDVVNLGEKVFRNIEKYGVPDWYEWSVREWGTKWNTCDTYITDDGKTIYFDTAWSPSIPAIEKFAKMHPGLKVTHEYAEEQMGFMSGRLTYENGELSSEEEFDPYSKEAYEMSFELWGGEDEYRFNEEKGTYEYIEDAEEAEL